MANKNEKIGRRSLLGNSGPVNKALAGENPDSEMPPIADHRDVIPDQKDVVLG
jgi:hypothetical protein